MKIKAIVATAVLLFSGYVCAETPQQVCKGYSMSAMKVKWLFEERPMALADMLQTTKSMKEPLRTEMAALYKDIYARRNDSDETVFRFVYLNCMLDLQ